MLYRLVLLIATTVFVSGCSTFGIYTDEFSCPNTYNGRCVSLPKAHELSLQDQDNAESDPATAAGKKKKQQSEEGEDTPAREDVAHVNYKESLYKKFDSLIKEPNMPVVAPPQVMRVLLLPYKGDSNELFMLRHVYFFVDEPKWLLGDSLLATEED